MNVKNQPLVSVIVPIYNVEDYLNDCIDSILMQTYSNLEIILVNDGSADNSYAICEDYATLDHRVIVVDKENGGVSTARNAGLDVANGDFVVFVDSDDRIAPTMIEVLVREFPAENAAVAVGFSRYFASEHVCDSGEYVKEECSDIRSFTRCRSGMFPWGTLYSRSVIEKIHLRFDTSLSYVEDVVFNVCYLSEMVGFAFLPAKLYYYRQNPTSITSRCRDKSWQLWCWFQARRLIFDWFAIQKKADAKVLRFAWRYCTNNIFAEALVGNLNYADYAAQYVAVPKLSQDIFEWMLDRQFPWLYYFIYKKLMRLRNLLRRRSH